jgi:hypothetical protein
LVVSGLLNRQIAAELGITDSPVMPHRLGHAEEARPSLADVGESGSGTEPGLPKANTCYYASDQHHGLIDRVHLYPYP